MCIAAGCANRIAYAVSGKGTFHRALGWRFVLSGICAALPIFCWLNGFYQFTTKRPQSIFIEGPLLLIGILLGSYLILKVFDEPLRAALGRAAWLPGAAKRAKLDSPSTVQYAASDSE